MLLLRSLLLLMKLIKITFKILVLGSLILTSPCQINYLLLFYDRAFFILVFSTSTISIFLSLIIEFSITFFHFIFTPVRCQDGMVLFKVYRVTSKEYSLCLIIEELTEFTCAQLKNLLGYFRYV